MRLAWLLGVSLVVGLALAPGVQAEDCIPHCEDVGGYYDGTVYVLCNGLNQNCAQGGAGVPSEVRCIPHC